jgi:uncharacterized protein
LTVQYFSPRSMMHHYLSMAKSVMSNDLAGPEVKLKKYFYALRPILACRWITDFNEVPPMEFGKLRKLANPDLNRVIDDLLEKKTKVNEAFVISPIMEMHHWLDKQIEYCEKQVPKSMPTPENNDDLNLIFRKYLQ